MMGESDDDDVSTIFVDENYGRSALGELDELRRAGELVDCTIQIDGNQIRCHRVLLAARSPYFRAMFRNQDMVSESIDLVGMDFHVVSAVIDYFYTGTLQISIQNVSCLLSVADQLLVTWIMDSCASFLLSNLNLYTVLAAWRLASLYRLKTLERASLNFCNSEFNRLAESTEWVEFESNEIEALVRSDQLIVKEDDLVNSIVRWCESRGTDIPTILLENIRFSLCSENFLWRIENDESFTRIRESQQFQDFRCKERAEDILSQNTRVRGTNDILAVHHDASDTIYGYNIQEQNWQEITKIPETAGYEYSSLASYRHCLYLIGGRSKGGQTLRKSFVYDFTTEEWSTLPDMNEVRWYHGTAVIGSKLYAVTGCREMNSIEVLYLDDGEGMRWKPLVGMNSPRHMPGVGALKERIYVVGGSDDSWTAQSTVEMFDTVSLEWLRLPDLLVPRVQPAVVGVGDKLYVMGGRNSNKVELMSVEMWDPVEHKWTLCKEMHRKRWGGGGGCIFNLPVIVGGRGKRATQAEVYSQKTNTWSNLPGEIPCADRSYSAAMVQKPWNWAFE